MADRLRPKELLIARNPIVKATVVSAVTAVGQEMGLDYKPALSEAKDKNAFLVKFVPEEEVTKAVKKRNITRNYLASEASKFGIPPAMLDPDKSDTYFLEGNTLKIAEPELGSLAVPLNRLTAPSVVASSQRLYGLISSAILEQVADPVVVGNTEVADVLVQAALTQIEELANRHPDYALNLRRFWEHARERLTTNSESLIVVARGARLELRMVKQVVKSQFLSHDYAVMDLITRVGSVTFNRMMSNTLPFFPQSDISSPLTIPKEDYNQAMAHLQWIKTQNPSMSIPDLYTSSVLAKAYCDWIKGEIQKTKKPEAAKLVDLIDQIVQIKEEQKTEAEKEKETMEVYEPEVIPQVEVPAIEDRKKKKADQMRKERRRQQLAEAAEEEDYYTS